MTSFIAFGNNPTAWGHVNGYLKSTDGRLWLVQAGYNGRSGLVSSHTPDIGEAAISPDNLYANLSQIARLVPIIKHD